MQNFVEYLICYSCMYIASGKLYILSSLFYNYIILGMELEVHNIATQ
jgi:hypothetical protein